MLTNGEARKDIKKGVYATVGGLIVMGLLNAVAVYNNTQVFETTTKEALNRMNDFMSAQQTINSQQSAANESFRIAVAELKQQSADQSRRLEMLENKAK